MKKRNVALILALALVLTAAVGGTLAWLTAKSEMVVNTFTTSDIKVELKENTGETYKMVPGSSISKDPKATVLAGSEKCYLFVKLEKSSNFDNYLTYEMADGWEKLTGVTGVTGVYYRVVDGTANEIGTAYSVLKDNKVSVKNTVTKEMMSAIDGVDADGKTNTDAAEAELSARPTLTITAYASQLYNDTATIDVKTAWGNIS